MYLVECKPDAVLVKTLTAATTRKIIHAGNKPELLKMLTKSFKNSKGVMDEDPLSYQPPLLRKFMEMEKLTSYGIKIFHQKRGDNTLIVLCPRLEEWILEAAHEAKISLQKYGLPDNPEELHKQINIKTDNFQKLVEDVKAKSERIKKLRHYLKSA